MRLKAKLGGLAQLARAPALQAGGHRFESDILHTYAKASVCRHRGASRQEAVAGRQRVDCRLGVVYLRRDCHQTNEFDGIIERIKERRGT